MFNTQGEFSSLLTVFVVGLEYYSDLWGYAVEPLMPDRPKMRDQTKKHMGVYAVRATWYFSFGLRLLTTRDCASEPGTA